MRTQFIYSSKAANLATCFLGLTIHSGPDCFLRSAQLGMLASIFDLASDGLQYDLKPLKLFRNLASETLDRPTADILLNMIEQKRTVSFGLGGLERGIGAFRVVIGHLRSEEAWEDEATMKSTGILLQAVDDLLDYRDDEKNGHLNFARCPQNAHRYLRSLVGWDYKRRFSRSPYPLVLFYAIKRAQVIGEKLLASHELGKQRSYSD